MIFHNLDVPPPSFKTLRYVPTPNVTDSEYKPLKALSAVSRKLRVSVVPLLFRHGRLKIKPSSRPVDSDERPLRWLYQYHSVIRSLIARGLSWFFQSFTIIIAVPTKSLKHRKGDFFIGPNTFWPDPVHFPVLCRFTFLAPPSVLRLLLAISRPDLIDCDHGDNHIYLLSFYASPKRLNGNSPTEQIPKSEQQDALGGGGLEWGNILLNEGFSLFSGGDRSTRPFWTAFPNIAVRKSSREKPPSLVHNFYPTALKNTRSLTYVAILPWRLHAQRAFVSISRHVRRIHFQLLPHPDDDRAHEWDKHDLGFGDPYLMDVWRFLVWEITDYSPERPTEEQSRVLEIRNLDIRYVYARRSWQRFMRSKELKEFRKEWEILQVSGEEPADILRKRSFRPEGND